MLSMGTLKSRTFLACQIQTSRSALSGVRHYLTQQLSTALPTVFKDSQTRSPSLPQTSS